MERSKLFLYREFQFSWLIAGIFGPMQVLITYLYIFQVGNNPMPLIGYLFMTILFVVIVLLFYAMTTTVDRERVTISFGIGLIRKKIPIERVKSALPVTSPWYYGYGIRLIPNGWLYNVSGSQGVEMKFKDRKGVIRIGTRNPAMLAKQILNAGTNAA